MDVATLYCVLIKLDDKTERKIQEDFFNSFKSQLMSDSIWQDEFCLGIKTATNSFYMYKGYEKSAQAISNNIISKLKRVFDNSKNIESMKRFAKKNINEIPWKLINFHNAKELMMLEIQNYR